MKKALILLGCPEAPSQTPMAVYATYKLTKMGYDVTVASTPSAMKLIEVSDPETFYIKSKIDIESCLENLESGAFDLLVGFVHKDAAVSYFVTFYHILNTTSIALVFEKDPDLLEKFEKMVKENTDAEIVAVRAYHNPTPMKVKFDRAIKKLEG
ncbi:DUF1890 domain-containing protein [Methanobacterium paludis]|uniref:Uncharacterized conserved protein UCP006600 n=1 Tax=Methanobacterium paludis (strain DSM 25820 / JCM 18151 / SWAN1) TaxID=868131 RepID=F6D465_METPW|nr:DUF1890 domain-containing protein [Methanobacterium paludis]AEG17487.1 Uncharacterized conserved protein UCP006600 [Methanobacterium paludis]